MIVRVEDIKKVALTLLNKIDSIGDYQIDLNFTTYWNISFEDGQSLIPEKPTPNDLRDEWRTLRDTSSDNRPVKKEDFEMLGNLLKAVGLKIERLNEEKRRN